MREGILEKQYLYYQFPFGKVSKGEGIILWGYGRIGKQYLNQIRATQYCSVKYIVDANWKNINVCGIEVCDPERIRKEVNPHVIVSTKKDVHRIKEELNTWGVEDNNVIFADTTLLLPASTQEKITIEDEFIDYYYQLKSLLKTKKILKDVAFVRTGREYDGGYVMVDDFRGGKMAYSFGIADDISWDLDIANKGYDVYMYDHTIDGIKGGNEQTHFIKKGLAGKRGSSVDLETLEELLMKNGHDRENGMILKIDIEGAEWEFIENIASDILKQFDQIVFELHEFVTSDNRERILKCLGKLNETHQCVHIHANNMSSHIMHWEGGILPECIETTYVNRNKYSFNEQTEKWSLSVLDQPNLKGVDEIYLSEW